MENEEKRMRFLARVSRKVTVWVTDKVIFHAKDEKAAEEYINSNAEYGTEYGWDDEDGITVERVETETEWDTTEYITEEENGGNTVVSVDDLEKLS